MDERKRGLKGSPSRDEFKVRHKKLAGDLYAIDIDFALVRKNPHAIVAFLDYKKPGDSITFAETVGYNHLIGEARSRVYIVEGQPEGPFKISRYMGGDPGPPTQNLDLVVEEVTWAEFEDWERQLREAYAICSALGAHWPGWPGIADM